MSKPMFVDLYCGLGGWAEGILAEGGDVVGFDIEQHVYGAERYPGQLVLQDVLTLTGAQFRGKICAIVASPPCTEPSYRAMPWSRAKALNAIGPPHKFIELFNACFRIAREAEVPLIVENVCGAQRWVGRAGWHFGSFYLWGDVPALMPVVVRRNYDSSPSHGRDVSVGNLDCDVVGSGIESGERATCSVLHTKNSGGSWFNIAHNTKSGRGQNPDGRKIMASCSPRRWEDREVKRLRDASHGSKGSGDWFGRDVNMSLPRSYGSKSSKRKWASAQIAKIPFPLASHIARSFMAQEVCR